MTAVLLYVLRLVVGLWPRCDRQRFAADLVAAAEARAAEAGRSRGPAARWRCLLDEVVAASGEAWHLRRWRRSLATSGTRQAALAGWRGDVVRAWRGATRRPVTALGITVTIAAVVAATATALGVATAVLWRPLPYPAPNRLVFLWEAAAEDGGAFRVSRASAEAWRRAASSIESMAFFGASSFALETPDGVSPFRGVRVSPGYFTTLGARPLLGHTLEGPARLDEIVLSERAWRTRFGAAPEIVGRTVRLSGAPFTIVGVMPDRVSPGWPANPAHIGLDPAEREYWVSLPPPGDNLRSHLFGVVARLRPGAEATDVAAELSAAAAEGDGHAAVVTAFRDQFVHDARRPLLVILAAVVALLMAAIANLAALQATAYEQQRQEFSVRAALGAGRGRLVRAIAVDVGLHSLLGVACGLAAARMALAWLPEMLPPTMPFVTAPALDATVVGAAVAIGVLSTALMAAWPAARLLAGGPARNSRSVIGGRVYRGLVVAQVALGVASAVPAGLLGRSLAVVLGRDAGFAMTDVVVTDVALPGPTPGANPPMAEVTRFETDVRAALASRADVRGVALAYDHPLESNWSDVLVLPSPGQASDEQQVQLRIVSPSYFAALEVDVLTGRVFDDADRADRPGLAVINRALAERIGRQALGLRVTPGGPRFTWGAAVPDAFTVVGVVDNERFRGLEADAAPALYLSTRQFPMPEVSLLTRTAPGRAEAVAADVAAIVRGVAPVASVARPRLLTALRDVQLAPRSVTARVVTVFAAITVGLAVLGVYGGLAAAVSARRREVGVRLALGESPRLAAGRVVADGLATVGVGLALGLVGAAASGRLVAHVLVGVTPADPLVVGGVMAGLLAAAGAASVVPAWRAAHVDPVEVLRAE